MDWKQLLAYITGSVDQELLRNEYLLAENRILRQQMKGRVRLSDGEHQTLAAIGKQLGKQALAEIATIVRPDTMPSPSAQATRCPGPRCGVSANHVHGFGRFKVLGPFW